MFQHPRARHLLWKNAIMLSPVRQMALAHCSTGTDAFPGKLLGRPSSRGIQSRRAGELQGGDPEAPSRSAARPAMEGLLPTAQRPATA
jgi:hypothetical protein